MSAQHPYGWTYAVVQRDNRASKPRTHHPLRPRLPSKGEEIDDSNKDGEEDIEWIFGSNEAPDGSVSRTSKGDKQRDDREYSETETGEGWMLVNIDERDDDEDAKLEEELAGKEEEEQSPLYVHAKQYHRILIRRSARQRLEEYLRVTWKDRKPYLHECRHGQCRRRPRGPDGRFLTVEEIVERERSQGIRDGVDGITTSIAEAGLE